MINKYIVFVLLQIILFYTIHVLLANTKSYHNMNYLFKSLCNFCQYLFIFLFWLMHTNQFFIFILPTYYISLTVQHSSQMANKLQYFLDFSGHGHRFLQKKDKYKLLSWFTCLLITMTRNCVLIVSRTTQMDLHLADTYI